MTLQEIQYKAQGIIHKWRDDDSAPYIEFVEELAHMIVPEPSEDLEECENDFKAGYVKGYEQAENNLGWISVKDRLPDTMDYVFTCIKMCGIPQCVGFHYYKDGIWWEGYEEHAVSAVEYWMPIPPIND